MRGIAFATIVLSLTAVASADFTFDEQSGALTLLENGKPVFVYHSETVKQPEGVANSYARACYIHPLYGLNGKAATQDFPIDHRHHRGVFWAWPECKAGDRRMDVWEMKDVHQHHEEWLAREAGKDKAVLAMRNRWAFDDAPEKAVVREEVHLTTFAAEPQGRAIDFDITVTNVSEGPVTFLGALNKGYGGLCFRPDAGKKPFVFTTAKGECTDDALGFDTPWADVSWNDDDGGTGVAIFEHPSNPAYPFPGWIFRHYGFLGASWPHEQQHLLKPGESFQLRYRLYVHAGNAEKGLVAQHFQDFTNAVQH